MEVEILVPGPVETEDFGVICGKADVPIISINMEKYMLSLIRNWF